MTTTPKTEDSELDSEFRRRFRELKALRNSHQIDEPDFDEAVEQLAADIYGHPTEGGYCCACSYDKTLIASQVTAERERLLKELEDHISDNYYTDQLGMGRVVELATRVTFIASHRPHTEEKES